MNVTLLGTGGPLPDLRRHCAAILVQAGEDCLLFDAGRGVVLQTARSGVALNRLNPVFLTHHHADHLGDLYDVILSSWFAGRTKTLRIFGPPGTQDIVAALIGQVYAKDIAFRAAENKPGDKFDGSLIARLDVQDVDSGVVCESGGWRVSAERVEHGANLELPGVEWVCLGYRIEAEGKTLVISGDAVPGDGLDRLARGADVLIQCCYLPQAEIIRRGAEHFARTILPASGQVGKLAARAGVKKLVLTHFAVLPEAGLQEIEADVRRDFDGEIVLGEDLLNLVL